MPRWPDKTLAERFWEKVEKSAGCWNWIAGKHRDGYGHLKIKGKMELAHRVVIELEGADIPSGLCVCHSCDNPACVNPDHLFFGTHQDNMHDRDKKDRQGATKLTRDEADCIRRCKGRITQQRLGEIFGVTQTNISAIHTGKTWGMG